MTVLIAIAAFYVGGAFGFFVCSLLTHDDTPKPREDQ